MARELPAPHQPHLDSAADVLALWRCDEAGGAAFTDVRGAYTTTLGTLPSATTSLFATNSLGTGARFFNGTTQFASAPGNAAAAAVLAPTANGQGYAIEAWISCAAIGAAMTILSYGGTGETQVGNTLSRFYVTAAGKLGLFSEAGAGGDSDKVANNMTALVAGTAYHVAVVVRRRASTIDIEWYVNDVLVDRTTGATVPDGGTTSPLFVIGRNSDTATEGNMFFSGTIDDIRVTKFAPSSAYIRDGYARGARNFDYTTMYASGAWETHLWVYAQFANAATADFDRGIGYLDLGAVLGHDHVLGAEWSEDVDDHGRTGSVKLRRQAFKQNLALGWNFGALADANLLRPMQRIKIEVADVPLGYGRAAAKAHRQVVFEGVITKHKWPNNELELTIVDRIKGLQIAWTKRVAALDVQFCTGADRTMEQVVQDMLDSGWKPASGYLPNDDDQGTGGITAYFPGSASGFNIEGPFSMPNRNVAQAIEDIVTQIVWRARYRFDDFRKAFRYTVYDVNRAKTWAAGDIDLTTQNALEWGDLELDEASVRNKVDIFSYLTASSTHPDGNAENTGDTPVSYASTGSDATSITLYGERYCSVTPGTARNIKEVAAANLLRDGILSDLKDPKAQGVVRTLHRFGVDIEDMVRARADSQRFPADQDFALAAFKSSVNKDQRRTELTVRDSKPIAGHRRIHDKLLGSKGWNKQHDINTFPTPSTPTLAALAEGLKVSWTMPSGKGRRRYKSTEVHASTTTGFTPSSATLVTTEYGLSCIIKNLDPAVAWFIKLIHRDEMRNVSAASAQATTTPRYLPKVPGVKATLAADQATPPTGKNVDYFTVLKTFTTEANDHTNSYDNSTGAGGGVFTAPIDGFYDVAAGLEFTYSATGTVFPWVRHYRGATVLSEMVGFSDAAAATCAGRLPPVDTTVATTAPRNCATRVWMKAGDTLKLGYQSSAAGLLVKATSNTYFIVSYYSGGRE
jgi:hypothetical protein